MNDHQRLYNRDMLALTCKALQADPSMDDDQLAQALGLTRPAAAHYWRLKAQLGGTPMTDATNITSSINPDDFEEQFGENPTDAYNQTLAQSIQQQEKKPGFFSRFFGSPEQAPMINPPIALGSNPSSMIRNRSSDASAVNADYTVQTNSAVGPRLTTSTMTQEQLRTRRMNLIEGAKFGRPAHEAFMLVLLKGWLIIGPIAFVLLTTSEVAYILTRLVAPGDTSTYVITGGAFFIDVAMMFVTFGVAIKRRDLAEKREMGIATKREGAEVWTGTLMWLVFAAINIISQAAFLLHIIQQSGDTNMTLLYIFVGARVVGFILGDASTAFFLAKVDGSHIKLIARGEREKANLYKEITTAEGERQLIEAKSEADILIVRLEVQQRQAEANFLADLKRQMFTDILNRPNQLNAPAAQPDAPNKSRIQRMDR